MPDNSPPDWVADDTFFDEAWSDMDRRLQARNRRRRALYLLPLLALLLLLLAGTLVLWPSTDDTTAASQEPPVAAAAPATIETSEAVQPGTSTEMPTVTPQADPVAATNADYRRTKNITNKLPGRLPETAALPTDPAPARTAQTNVVDTISTLRYVIEWSAQLINPEVALPVGTEAAVVVQPRRWEIAGGINQYTDGPRPGYFGQVTYVLPAGKWLLPLALRVDRSYRRVTAMQLSDGSYALERLLDRSGSVNYLNAGSIPRELEGSTQLNTTAVEARIGLGRQVGKRISVSAGAGVAYLAGGRVPSVLSLDVGGSRILYLQPDSFNQGSSTANFPTADARDYELTTPINRLSATSWLSVRYHAGERLTLLLSATQGLGQTYRDGLLSVSATRAEVGAGFTF